MVLLAPYAEVIMLSKENYKKPLERKGGHHSVNLRELRKEERATWAQAFGANKVGVWIKT